MANYFDKFPLIAYNINKDKYSVNEYASATNIMVRLRVIREKLNAVFHYYEYTVKATERPDIIAEKAYGNPELHWLVLMSNNIVDPLYDWPLDYDQFDNYLANKYRQTPSQSNADALAFTQTNWHHYEQVLNIVNTRTGESTLQRLIITKEEYDRRTDLDFYNYDETPGSPQVITVGTDTVQIYEWKTRQSYYDYEDQLNEKKRIIKLIKPAYIGQIQKEFDDIMRNASVSYRSQYRRLN